MTRQASTPGGKAFGFSRVSSDDQARGGISLGLQSDAIRKYCRQNGLDPVHVVEVAETATFDDERVRFQAMLKAFAASADVLHLVVYKMDRSNRNSWDHARLEDLIRKHGKHLHAALDHFHLHKDSPPSEWDRFDMMAMFARSETRHLGSRVKACVAQQNAQGHWAHKAPPGYRKLSRSGIEPDPAMAPLMTQLLEMAATGNYSINRLVEEARNLGITFHGKTLDRNSVYRHITNPIYAGPYYFKDQLIKDYRHEPLISWETHRKILNRLTDYRRSEKKIREAKPLNGVLECGVCGKSITFFFAKKRYSYGFCGACKRDGRKHEFVPEPEIVRQLMEISRQVTLPPEAAEILWAGLEDFRRNEHELHETRKAALEKQVEALQKKLSKAFEAYSSGMVDSGTYSTNAGQWRREKETLEIELRQLLDKRCGNSIDDVGNAYKLAQELETTLELASTKALGQIARTVCTNLQVKNGTVEYSLAFPFDEIAKGRDCCDWRAQRESNSRPSGS